MNSLSIAVFLVAVAAASAHWGNGAIIAGPSGIVAGHGIAGHAGVVGPAGVWGHAGLVSPAGVWGHAGLVGPAGLWGHAGVLGHHGLAVPAGHGLEGQWVPDINEHLYDDGSYKPHVYGH